MDLSRELVDTAWFTTLDVALVELDPGEVYHGLARRWFKNQAVVDPPTEHLVLQSLLVRMAGLHRGIWQGLADDNPFAVWPLMRAFFELEVTMAYLTRHPTKIAALAAKPSGSNPGAPVLPTFSRMLTAVRDLIPAGQAAYQELSDITHIGVPATWSAHRVETADEGLDLQWSSRPTFRPEQVPVAASQLRQLVEGVLYVFGVLAETYLGE